MEGHADLHPVHSFQQGRTEDHRPRVQTKVISGFPSAKCFRPGQGIHTVFIMKSVPEGFFHQTTTQRQSGIYETDPPSSLSFPNSNHLGYNEPKMSRSNLKQIVLSLRRWAEINMQHSQAGWASALLSLLCLNITFNGHLPPESIWGSSFVIKAQQEHCKGVGCFYLIREVQAFLSEAKFSV